MQQLKHVKTIVQAYPVCTRLTEQEVTLLMMSQSGVDQSNPPMSDLRRRIRKTLNKTRNSSVF